MWLAAAETHPFSVHTLRAIEEYSKYRALGPGEDRHNSGDSIVRLTCHSQCRPAILLRRRGRARRDAS